MFAGGEDIASAIFEVCPNRLIGRKKIRRSFVLSALGTFSILQYMHCFIFA
jgi:hypothetical protein